MSTDRAPAGGTGVVRLDLSVDRARIEDCLAESNPTTEARPGSERDIGWWGVPGPDGLAGVIGASRHAGACPESTSWHLHGLGVRPAARRRGYGQALTAAATRAGLAAGADWVSLGVWAANAGAISVYHRLGFVTNHRRNSYRPVGRPSGAASRG